MKNMMGMSDPNVQRSRLNAMFQIFGLIRLNKTFDLFSWGIVIHILKCIMEEVIEIHS